jgi:hypothetical protein
MIKIMFFFYIFVKELLNSILNKLELFSKKKINDIKFIYIYSYELSQLFFIFGVK